MTFSRGVTSLGLLFLLASTCVKANADGVVPSHYYWNSSPADGSAQILTLFCRACEDSAGTGRDIPLVSVLRDKLGDAVPGNDRLSYLWLLTYSRPTWEKRALSAVPFFYWKIGGGSSKVGNRDLKPMMNLSAPQRSVVSKGIREVVQWTVLDPVSMSVRASTRAYQNNRQDHERLHLEEAEGYLQSAPVADDGNGLNRTELNTVIARLELRKSMLGDFVEGRRASEFGEDANIELESTRARNWELLRQCADKTGLFFEPIDLAGAKQQYAVLWYPVERAAPPQGTSLGRIWKLLNLKNPYSRRDQLLEKPRYERTFDGRRVAVVPLGVYSLIYPKMPLLMVDFRDGSHLKLHELTQRAITEITSGVIGVSHFTNWYYFVAADLYDFYASRRGTATNRQERLNCYSKFRVALALDQNVDPSLRAAMQRRVSSFGTNPLETSAQKELQAALERYDRLHAAAENEHGPLVRRLEKDRRSELARFEASKFQATRGGIFHYATLGLYTRRAQGQDYLERLDRYRQADHYLNFLDNLSAAGTNPEVAFDRTRIEKAVADLTWLMSAIESKTMRQHAEQTIETLGGLANDAALKTQCRAFLDSIRQDPALAASSSGAEEGSGTPEAVR